VGYTALYRKWRPKTFKDIIGQSHITVTLENQILTGSVAHAYLFSGGRGTGKTSTAKVFARAINCLDRQKADPCNKCQVCINISKDTVMDILEIDAASNNGVNEIRELRENVKYTPTVGRYKVYIIDEVHMLSTGAFNALLKTLEEPPDHVVFILATTEPYKLPATITSRCQCYNFKRISTRDISSRLADVIASLNLEAQPEAIDAIARAADGSLRDALSLLDRTVSYGMERLTMDRVNDLLGMASNRQLIRMVDGYINRDIPQCLDTVHKLYNDGGDIQHFIKQLIDYYRNLLIIKVCKQPDRLLDVDETTMAHLTKQAKKVDQNTITRTVHILSETEDRCKWSSRPRVLLEMAVVDICKPQVDQSLEGLMERVSILEEMLENKALDQKAGQTYPRVSGKNHTDRLDDARISDGEVSVGGKPAGVQSPAEGHQGEKNIHQADVLKVANRQTEAEEIKQSPSLEKDDQPLFMERSGQAGSMEKAEQPGPMEGDGGTEGKSLTSSSAEDSSLTSTSSDPVKEQGGKRALAKGEVAEDQTSDEILTISKHWPQILDNAKKQKEMLISTFMHLGKPIAVKGGDVYIEFPKEAQMHMDMLNTDERRAIIGDIIYKICGKQYGVKFVAQKKESGNHLEDMDKFVNTIVNEIGIDNVDIIE